MPAASAGSVHGQPDPLPSPPPAAPRIRWGDLRKRAISAALLAPLAVACLWLGGWWWTALLTVAGVGLAMEWGHLCGSRLASPEGAAVPLLVLLAGALACLDRAGLGVGVIGAGFLLAWALGGRASLAAGIPYVGGAIVALAWLRGDGAPDIGNAGRDNVLFLLLVVWASDIGAYTAGRLLGGPKLAPRISPSKTWSGAAGGLAGAMAVGAAAALALHGGSVAHILPVAAGIGVAAQIGDLLESAVKRHYGVKDSGRLIPGHGGLLDRLDGLLTAAPVAALLAAAMGRGVELWR
jgi:phosphatidate cytidylyltransferase